MKKMFVMLCLVVVAMSLPSFGVAKEIIQLQQQVQNLQDQMSRMQQGFDERMGVMRNLVEQTTDGVNKMTNSVTELQTNLSKQNGDAGAKVDQVSTQVQALHDSVDELKARLAKVSKQLDDMQAAQQNLTAPAPSAQQPPQSQAPPPDVLYNNALRDYNAAKYDLATQEFADYLKFYSNSELAGNAQFYLADLEYKQGNYEQAVKDFDKVLEQYPGGNKTAGAQLKKGFALLELGQKQQGVEELRSLVARFPKSVEAIQAKDRLRKLGVATTAAPTRRR